MSLIRLLRLSAATNQKKFDRFDSYKNLDFRIKSIRLPKEEIDFIFIEKSVVFNNFLDLLTGK